MPTLAPTRPTRFDAVPFAERPTTRRRVGAFAIDAVVVGVPCVFVEHVIPGAPLGLMAWSGYRVAGAVTGVTIGRRLSRWRLVAREDTTREPGWAGLVYLALTVLPAIVATGAVWVGSASAGHDGWWSRMLALTVAVVAGAAAGGASIAWLWAGLFGSGDPRIARLSHTGALTVRHPAPARDARPASR